MARLTPVSATEMRRVLLRAGFVEDRQKGSHLTMLHPASRRRVVVPMHSGDLSVGLVRNILSQAGLEREEFESLRR